MYCVLSHRMITAVGSVLCFELQHDDNCVLCFESQHVTADGSVL